MGARLSGRTWLPLVAIVAAVLLVGSLPALAEANPTAAPSPAPTLRSGPTSSPSSEAAHPAAAITLTDPGVTPSAVSLSWTASNSLFLTNYQVSESNNSSGGPWTVVATTSTGTTSLAIGSLTPGGAYWWMVTANVWLGSASVSNVLPVVQPTLAYLYVASSTSTSVTLNWTNNATYGGLLSFVSYQVIEVQNGGAPSVPYSTTTLGTLSTTITGLSSGAGYSFTLNTTDCLGGCGAGTTGESWTHSNTLSAGTLYSLAVSVSASRSFADLGQLVLFSCNPIGGQSPYKFAWNFGDGVYVTAGGSVSQSFAKGGYSLIVCRVTDHAGQNATNSYNLTLYPALTISASTNRTAADLGEAVSFTCSVTPGAPPVTVDWSFGDGQTYSGTDPDHAYTGTGTYLAQCTGSDAAGESVVASIPINITGSLGTSVSVNSMAAAPGTPLTFTATPTGGSGVYPFLNWSLGDGTTGTGGTVVHAFATAANYTVLFVVRDSNGIRATSSTRVDISPIVASVPSFSDSLTAGGSVTYAASATGGAGAPYNYTWTFGDGATGYGAAPTHTYGSAGTFHPSLTVRDRLGASINVTLATVSVASAPSPWAWITALVVLGLAALFGLVLAFAVYGRRRRRAVVPTSELLARYVPPTAPNRSLLGSKVCPSCGTSNASFRRACSHCGAALPRKP